ncbi:uncharacterized protein HaLaN_08662, partial [Haematococcus lacustris]
MSHHVRQMGAPTLTWTVSLPAPRSLACLCQLTECLCRDPIDRMITYFTTFFSPQGPRHPDFSLAIQGGKGGARLTHNHERQYHYVLQSLTLWREVSTDMFKAREAVDHACFSWQSACHTSQSFTWHPTTNVTRASCVGKGWPPVPPVASSCRQPCLCAWLNLPVVVPGRSRPAEGGQQLPPHRHRPGPEPCAACSMRQQSNAWHPGQMPGAHWDLGGLLRGALGRPQCAQRPHVHGQVPRILNPVVLVLDELPKLYRDPEVKLYIDSAFGSVEHCQLTIMTDFCRHAFDGSGADNFFDAGSCVDGRLTSAWNWCARLEKKPYFHVFRLCGFTSFDGDFK